jgi:squalene-associated FAD-dependent desaturase
MKAASGGRVHVVGAGLAGLSAAVALADAGRAVILYEAAPQAGGRCRSYFDAEIDCRIDNGNHLLLSGNRAALDYLDRIGARGSFESPAEARFPFVHAATGERWTLQPNSGALPWWILSPNRRVPQTRAYHYLRALALWCAGPSATIANVLDPRQRLFHSLWEPLAVAALNTSAEQGSATLFWRILAETLGRGGATCRPLFPRIGLSESFVEPALGRLRARGAQIHFGARLRALTFGPDAVSGLAFDATSSEVDSADSVILAVPAPVAARLVPALTVPDQHSPIVNAHFRCARPVEGPFFVGVVGGAAEWIFRKPGVLSVTVSAADRFVECDALTLRDLLWHDAAFAYQLPPRPAPPVRIVKERRATFLASPEQLKRRPQQTTAWRNLLLAGDYVDTGLPATIEGAIRSGFVAAGLVAGHQDQLLTRRPPGSRNSPRLATENKQKRLRALP